MCGSSACSVILRELRVSVEVREYLAGRYTTSSVNVHNKFRKVYKMIWPILIQTDP